MIDVRNVSKIYGAHQVKALTGVSLTIAAGEFVALMGPSGCGKSTLLNLLGGLDQPSTGTLSVAGLSLQGLGEGGLTRYRRDRVGFIFQFFNLLNTLTVAENVALPLELGALKISQTEIRQRVSALLERVGILQRQHFYPAQLSGGEMQRVAITRALIHDPAVILADEPTGNLDTETGVEVLTLLQSLSSEFGKTIVMATHSDEASAYTHRVIRMRDGKILS